MLQTHAPFTIVDRNYKPRKAISQSELCNELLTDEASREESPRAETHIDMFTKHEMPKKRIEAFSQQKEISFTLGHGVTVAIIISNFPINRFSQSLHLRSHVKIFAPSIGASEKEVNYVIEINFTDEYVRQGNVAGRKAHSFHLSPSLIDTESMRLISCRIASLFYT